MRQIFRLMLTLWAVVSLQDNNNFPPISFENWQTSFQESYVQALVEEYMRVHSRNPIHFISETRAKWPIIIRFSSDAEFLAYGLPGNYGHRHDYDVITLSIKPYRSINNSWFNTVFYHELDHALRDHSNYLSNPIASEEGLATAFEDLLPSIFGSELRIELPNAPRARNRSGMMTVPLVFSNKTSSRSIGLRSAVWQDNPARSCAAWGCWDRYSDLAFPISRFISVASHKMNITQQEVYFRITRRLYSVFAILDENRRQLRLDEIWTGLAEEFPEVAVDGQTPSVYFGTHGPYLELPESRVYYGLEVHGSWMSRDGKLESGPVNASSWQFNVAQVKERSYFLSPQGLVSFAGEEGYYLELLDAHGKRQCIMLYDCSEEKTVYIKPVTGVAYGAINNPNLESGLYQLRALDESKNLLTKTYWMELPASPSMNPHTDGVYIWDIGPDDSIIPSFSGSDGKQLEISGCTISYAGNGLIQAHCPVNISTINIRGQSFDICPDNIQIIRPNGSRLWPLFGSDPNDPIGLSALSAGTTIKIKSINPEAHDAYWDFKVVVSSGERDQSWLQVNRLGSELIFKTSPSSDSYRRSATLLVFPRNKFFSMKTLFIYYDSQR